MDKTNNTKSLSNWNKDMQEVHSDNYFLSKQMKYFVDWNLMWHRIESFQNKKKQRAGRNFQPLASKAGA